MASYPYTLPQQPVDPFSDYNNNYNNNNNNNNNEFSLSAALDNPVQLDDPNGLEHVLENVVLALGRSNEHGRRSEEKMDELSREIQTLQSLLNDMSKQMGIIWEQGKENSARLDSISELFKENFEQGKKDRTRFENWIKVVYIQGQRRVNGMAGKLQETQEKFIQTQTGVAKLQDMLRDIFTIEDTPQRNS